MPIALNKNIVPVGQNYVTAAFGASTLINLVPPSTNSHGLIIRTLTLNAGNGSANIFANATAPASPGDFSTRLIFEFSNATGGGSATLPYEVYVYPGMGIWVSNNNTSGSGNAWMTYDLITPDQVG